MASHMDRYRNFRRKWAVRISSNTCHCCPHSYRISSVEIANKTENGVAKKADGMGEEGEA